MKLIILSFSFLVTLDFYSQTNLSDEIYELGFYKLFNFQDNTISDSIWDNGKNEQELLKIIEDTNANKISQVIASELLFNYSPSFPDEKMLQFLPKIYCNALQMSSCDINIYNEHLAANNWGFMYDFDSSGINHIGKLGNHLLISGKDAIPYLMTLLEDESFICYDGSKEATMGNGLRLRVKDAAAFYISKLLNRSISYHESLVKRDYEISRLILKINQQYRLK